MEKGQALAARCSEFDYAVQNLTQAASVPTIPVTGARLALVCYVSSFFVALSVFSQIIMY